MAYMTKEEIEIFQSLLNLQGADLDVDGIKGPLTKAAMLAFRDGLMFPVEKPTDPLLEDETVEIKAYEYTRNIAYGETSDEVKQLQAMLKYQGFGKYLGSCGIDGIFGYGTRKGVEEYVRGRGLNTKAIEKTQFRTVTKEIWEMFHLSPYDIENSKWTDEYMKCNCGGRYCNGLPKPYGVSVGLKVLLIRLENAIKAELGNDADLCLTDDIGRSGGVRCSAWNKRSGGATYSSHISGKAADWIVKGVRIVSYKNLQQIASLINPYGGCSLNYGSNGHVDTRGKRSRW